jgi:hypothetical protein
VAAPRSVASALYGAWRLARFDPGGMSYFDLSIDGFWASFLAAALLYPLYVLQLFLLPDWHDGSVDTGTLLLVRTLAYGISWIDFPLIAIVLTRYLGLGGRYVPFIIALNWASVLQGLLQIALVIVKATGILGEFADLLWFAGFIVVLVYQWYVTRVSLGAPAGMAAALVVIDQILNVALLFATDPLL